MDPSIPPLSASPRDCGGAKRWNPRWLLFCGTATALIAASAGGAAAQYRQTNLVSNIPGQALFSDPNLVTPWGLAASPTSPFWVANNGTGTSTIYDGTGQPSGLVVTIPPQSGGVPPSSPTGAVFNGGASFSGDRFLFATEQGTISGWQSSAGTIAPRRVDNSGFGANYKGLAEASNAGGDFLCAANFHSGAIDVFDAVFSQTALPGSFVDPNLPSGYAPFNIQSLGGQLCVTYALQDPTGEDDLPGAGHGFVDVFDSNGSLLRRLVSGGVLNSPWGVALAPSDFGAFSNDLLVGNLGDGRINAFDPITGGFEGFLTDPDGNPIVIDGLRGLSFGNGGSAGSINTLYFTAGVSGEPGKVEAGGLFGSLETAAQPVPEPGTLALLVTGAIGLALTHRKRPC
jgi:uncharacterized protein (TIGR03118 family)